MFHRHGAEPASSRSHLEVADIFREHGPEYRRTHTLTPPQYKAMIDIERCRTAALGGHLDVCDHCGYSAPSYNSCGNRHCPKCQCLTQAQWVRKQEERILPTVYFHGVFTLPCEIRPLALSNAEIVYNLLFRSSADTLLTLGLDPKILGAHIGFTAILHTWTREMLYHPHLHFIIPGGGLDQNNRWVSASKDFFIHVNVISSLFRGKFLSALNLAYQNGQLHGPQASPEVFPKLKDQLYGKNWRVYAKKPFGGAEHVFKYLGRYTHRVAISNQRLISLDENGVTFYTKNNNRISITPEEFIRRFLLHILPSGFTKIRHYGLLAPSNAKTKLEEARRQLECAKTPSSQEPEQHSKDHIPKETWPEFYKRLTGIDIFLCPACGLGRLIRMPLDIDPKPIDRLTPPKRGP